MNEKIEMGHENRKEPAYANRESQDFLLITEQSYLENIVYQHPHSNEKNYVQSTINQHHQKQLRVSKSLIIVTGDGMHHFLDGLAIGIGFAGSGLSGGLSTSVSILCHELPHEIGDFAILLNAGFSSKRAVMYHFFSAVLCFIVMTIGLLVGEISPDLLSSAMAGIFLYIALVNMIPQLECYPNESTTIQVF